MEIRRRSKTFGQLNASDKSQQKSETANKSKKQASNYSFEVEKQLSMVRRQRDILKQGNTRLIQNLVFQKKSQGAEGIEKTLKEKQNQLVSQQKQLQYYKTLIAKYEQQTKSGKAVADSEQDQRPEKHYQKIQVELEAERRKNNELQESNFLLGQDIKSLMADIDSLKQQLIRDCQNEQTVSEKQREFSSELESQKKIIEQKTQLIKQNEAQVERLKQKLSEKDKAHEAQVKRVVNVWKEKLHKFEKDLRKSETQHNVEENELSVSRASNNSNNQSKDEKFLQVSKLERVNRNLEKDYKISCEKIKDLNRQISRLTLQTLKHKESLQNEKYRIEKKYEEYLDSLERDLQNCKKICVVQKQELQSIQKEKESEKAVLKELIIELENKSEQTQKNCDSLCKQVLSLKAQLSESQRQSGIQTKLIESEVQNKKLRNELQFERAKFKNYQSSQQEREKEFEKSLKYYEQVVQEYKRISLGSSRECQTRNTSQGSNVIEKDGVEPKSAKNLETEIELSQRVKVLQAQNKQLLVEVKYENQRYNLLENSNRELRKQLIKLIEQQEKLRKDLIGERVKNRTSSSRSFSRERSKDSLVSGVGRSRERKGSILELRVSSSRENLVGDDLNSRQPKTDRTNPLPVTSTLKQMRQKRFNNTNIQKVVAPERDAVASFKESTSNRDSRKKEEDSKGDGLHRKFNIYPPTNKNLTASDSKTSKHQAADHTPLSTDKLKKQDSQSQSLSENQEVKFQISSSRSNLSGNKLKQIELEMEDSHGQLPVNSFDKQPKEDEVNTSRGNFVKRKLQATRSNGEVRFARRQNENFNSHSKSKDDHSSRFQSNKK